MCLFIHFTRNKSSPISIFTCNLITSDCGIRLKTAFFIPPKIEQSTNHGGTFIFSSSSVIFAHYDEAPGTHAVTFEVVDLAIREAELRRNQNR